MDYLYAFLIGGAICALVQILMEKTKLLPGRIMVFAGMYRSGFRSIEYLSAIRRICGSGSQRSIVGVRKYFVEGCERGDWRIWIYRHFHGRFYFQLCGNLCRFGIWLSGLFDL